MSFQPGDSVGHSGPYGIFLAEFVREVSPGIALVTVTDPLLSWHRKGEQVHCGLISLHPKATAEEIRRATP